MRIKIEYIELGGYKINTVGKNTNILNEFRIVNFSRTELFFVNYNTYTAYKHPIGLGG